MGSTKEQSRDYYIRNREKVLERSRLWSKNNREKVNAAKRKWRATRPPEKQTYDSKKKRIRHLKDLYGMTPEDVDSMLAKQGGLCAMCGTPDPNWYRGWHIDHDHATHKIRGILCHSCNILLGHAKDNVDILAKGIIYLNKFKEEMDYTDNGRLEEYSKRYY